MTVPVSVPTTSAAMSAGQYGQPCFPAMIANSAVAGTPMFPTAKLMTRLDR